jgi:hypothetical protein
VDQLKEFKESLVKFAAGNMTLVDEISAMQLVRLLLNCRFYWLKTHVSFTSAITLAVSM